MASTPLPWQMHSFAAEHNMDRCVIPRLTEALQRQDAFPVRSQEMPQCLRMYAQAYWQALPIKGLIYKAYLDRQVPGVQQVTQYCHFAEQVIMKEAGSLQKLGLEAVHMHLCTSSISQDSSTEAASAAETVSMSATETCANKDKCTLKRKRNEEADPEEQALLQAIKRQKRINVCDCSCVKSSKEVQRYLQHRKLWRAY